ncbi:DUF3093 domain-containing protein [uncultured Corynebacterium sp.]|uniref:DUF3093 domain-containing protein n=1 Tax=uncultured Corynebacterium sp. TaxID=159447 RepID=UPI0025D59CE5|nr:DUF3093 domain-containing protein [uncultured Corynebacterium sp.]
MSTSNDSTVTAADGEIIYRERLWVPWWYWALAVPAIIVCTAQIAFNRSIIWLIVGGLIITLIGLWILMTLSKTRVSVEVDGSGEHWLHAGSAILPATVVSKSLVVPESAHRNALGRQLDPAAFLVTHSWVRTMVLLVLDDPEDPTPYWLVSTRRPEELLDAFLGADRERA